ncbi:hypothetical protein [Encephalitozoon cuniculi GB-M1]|uniref:Uncharacterized protein n=2 Tax=Encephalitozoon cuniculi TaxID=6035 RepID=Q8SWK4_ENCCU|nr:uncharacterized protein ECU01_0950 [Encephalitozoon cuniculi GB-M1]AGE96100.1 hypothetical protein ECU01_0950 [Encephalitozoon cuniculi]KMV66748.1 hypothetical protein M970_010780 [Encephalitozoon cuniculi EcunIII-L]UYI28464.1 hypothetical protein J0A71_11g23770 [Encephalitozoon cuniculi]CAD24965.1 hypothetical protein [Encephalitozoon cuniculi GB-M1]
MVRERLTKEDEENIDMILNPYPLATEDALNEIEMSTDPAVRNQRVGDLSVILSNAAAVLNPRVQEKFPRLISLLKDKHIYNSSALMLSDACRHMEGIQNAFKALGIFELLDFTVDHYKATSSLVYSLCIENKDNTAYFVEKYYSTERDRDNALIQNLRGQSF